MNRARRTIQGWLQLVRPPNLFTVPGDPIAGYLLSGGGFADTGWLAALLVAIAACLLYMAGLVWNDYADSAEDLQERPTRPIPSGRVTRKHALWAGIFLMLGGITASWVAAPAAGVLALILTALVLAYNFGSRRIKALGLINMGLCRGTSVMLGAAATGRLPDIGSLPWLAAAVLVGYILAVTWIAYGETRQHHLGLKPWLPAVAASALFLLLDPTLPYARALLAATVIWLLGQAWTLRGAPTPSVVQPRIGSFIRSLLPLQAALCLAVFPTGLAPAAVLLAAWPVSTFAAKTFYGS